MMNMQQNNHVAGIFVLKCKQVSEKRTVRNQRSVRFETHEREEKPAFVRKTFRNGTSCAWSGWARK